MSPLQLAYLSAIVVLLALAAPLYTLVLFDLVATIYNGAWHLGGIRFDPSDLAFAGIALGLVLRGRLKESLRSIPYLGSWFLLGVLLSLSYYVAPINQEYLTDPVRIVYQLYRYAWKTILIYPIAVLLLRQVDTLRHAVFATVVMADVAALMAIPQGYSGFRARGPFESGNGLGASLVIPFLCCLGLLLSGGSSRRRAFTLVSLVILVRALLFARSRGAFVGIACGSILLLWLFSRLPASRSQLLRVLTLAVVAVLILLLAVPDLLERPNVQRVLSLSEGTEAGTFQWRLQERWPHFWAKALEHPLLGIGTFVDPSLGKRANTPHSGYLSVAVKHGFPVLALFLLFALRAIRDALRLYRRGNDPFLRLLGVVTVAAITACLVHSVIESVLLIPYVVKFFWLLVAMVAVASRQPELLSTGAPTPARAAPERRPAALPVEGAAAGRWIS